MPAAEGEPRRPTRDGRRYVITGGAGFIGSHLVQALTDSGQAREIVILDDLSTGRPENIEHVLGDDRVRFIEGSVTNAELVDELMEGADICVHLASAVGVQMIVNEPLDTLMRSVRGSNVVMHAASRHDVRVLFSSTSEVYGKQTNGAADRGLRPDLRFSVKGALDVRDRQEFRRGADLRLPRRCAGSTPPSYASSTRSARARRAPTAWCLPRFVRQALRGDDLTVYGTGAQTRCFTHVRDTVAALLLLCDNESASGRTFNIGSSTSVTIAELARRVIERCRSDSGLLLVPYEEAYGDGFEELGARRPDTTALRSLTGWETLRTVDDAIDDVIEYERTRDDSVAESEAADVA